MIGTVILIGMGFAIYDRLSKGAKKSVGAEQPPMPERLGT
jgi:hypothetical protein